MARKAFTLSVPSETHVKEADYFGMVSGRDKNKFDETGLTPVGSTLVEAPYVAEFPMILECRVVHHHEIGLHTHFIGEIRNPIFLTRRELLDTTEKKKPCLKRLIF